MTRRRRGRGDDGTALVEAAFVLPVLVIIVFGIIEVGFLYRSASVATAASRAGARLASQTLAYGGTGGTYPTQASAVASIGSTVTAELKARGITDTPQVLYIYKANASGFPGTQTDFSTCATSCFTMTWNSGSSSWNTATGTWATPDACGQVIDSVGVYLRMSHTAFVAPRSLSVSTVAQSTVMRFEPRQNCTTVE